MIFFLLFPNNYQLLNEVEQNIVICRGRADQLLTDAKGRGKLLDLRDTWLQITIFCENRVQKLFYHSLINLRFIFSAFFSLSKQDNLSSKSSAKRTAVASVKKIDGNALSHTIICTQLFAGKLSNQN